MKYGLTETTVENICAVFACFPEIEKAVLYGSRAKGNFKTGSDIDLTLCGEALTSDLCSTIASVLDDLLLPYTIDLSIFNEINHVKLREHIERVGVCFYERVNQGAVMKAGWQKKTLGQICQLISGRHVDAKDYNTDSRGVAYLTGPSDFGPVNPIISKWTEHPIAKARKGDILITVKGSGVGKINLLDLDEVAISRQLMAVRVTGADPKYILLYLSSTFDHFQSVSTGAAIPGISREQVLGLEIAIPPLPEQQRIVGILDEAFDGITTAKANAEKNLQNARALFASHLQSVFNQRGEGWVEKTLGDIAQVKGGKRVPKGYKLLTEATDYPYLRVTEFTDSGTIDMSDLRYVSPEVHREIKNYVIYSTDLYLSIAGTIGKTGIIPEELDGANLTENACRLVFNTGVSNRFVYYFTITPDFVAQAGLNTRTAAQPKLALSRLATIKLGIPPIVEQKRLAAEFDTLRGETQRLESIYQQKLTTLEALKKSLLHQAFSGHL